MSYAGIERRQWPRLPAPALGNVSVAILQGPDTVKLVDLSRGGVLLEVAARFPLKSSVRLRLTQPSGEVLVVDGRVARAKVAALVNGVINYRFAVIFDQPISSLALPATDEQLVPPVVATGDQSVADASGDVTDAAAQAPPAAAERTLAIVPPRARTGAGRSDAGDHPLPLRSELERERSRMEQELAAANARLARQSSVNESLQARLKESDERRTALRGELEAERRQWEEERSTFLQQVSDAVSVADDVQATLETREREQAQALSDQRGTYEALIAELMKSSNDQQTEYQQLIEELTAAGNEQRRRAEHHEAEVARERAAAHRDRADSEAHRHKLEARLEAAEALCAAHDARYQALRGQLERLSSIFTAPLSSEPSQPHEQAFADEADVERTRAIA